MNRRILKKKLIPLASFANIVEVKKYEKNNYIITHDYIGDKEGKIFTFKQLEKMIMIAWKDRFYEGNNKKYIKIWNNYQRTWKKRNWNY